MDIFRAVNKVTDSIVSVGSQERCLANFRCDFKPSFKLKIMILYSTKNAYLCSLTNKK